MKQITRFVVQKEKVSTARITMWKELNIPCVYTIEASFFGPSQNIDNENHFTTSQLMEIGKNLGQALLIYSQIKSANVITTSVTVIPNVKTI